jgi:pyruvate formate lyase activating enzyme
VRNESKASCEYNVTEAVQCDLCPRRCEIKAGGTGVCGARGVEPPGTACESQRTVPAVLPTASLNYGKITSIALDPIEKKPLRRFHPGSLILSAGSFGCNLNCPWCQNHRIARARSDEASTQDIEPEALVKLAKEYLPLGNIGVAFTYNEPLIGYEYVRDVSGLLKEHGLKSVIVTNGYISSSYFLELLPLIDAMNIDLKSIRNEFYQNIGGDVETVKQNIKAAFEKCHIEITCLLIEGKNDTEDEMNEMTDFISSVSTGIPFHIARFFPRYKLEGSMPTQVEKMEEFKEIADKKLNHVYLGNI